jgi:hypothetical protein
MLNDNQLQLIQNLSSDRDFNDNVKCFLTFGHLFEFNIPITLSQTYCLHGKPALNADAMAGAVRRYVGKDGKKVCAALWEEVGEESVTVYALRRDELETAKEFGFEAKPKSWTYSLEDARLRGALNQPAWKKMPRVMLHKRALTALLRLAFPEVIGTACSPDELAEVMIQDEAERDRIVFASVESARPPKSSTPPAPAPKKKTKLETPLPVPVGSPANPLRNFSNINTTIEEIKKEGVDVDQALIAMETMSQKPLNQCAPDQLAKLFYAFGMNPINVFLQDGKKRIGYDGFKEWDQADIKVLASLFDSFYGTCFDPAKHKDLAQYCYTVHDSSYHYDGAWSETMIMLRKQLNEELIDQKTFNEYEHAINTNPGGGTFFMIARTLGVHI